MSHPIIHSSLLAICLLTPNVASAQGEVPPFVFNKEKTSVIDATPTPFTSLKPNKSLPDPLVARSSGQQVSNLNEWENRRDEIIADIEEYEIGEKPSIKPEDIKASMSGDTLLVEVNVNGQQLLLKSTIRYPENGHAPYPLMIGTSMISLPMELIEKKGIATMTFHEAQVNDYSQWRQHHDRGEHNFDRLYPHLKDNGAYSQWSWGFSRLIDGLQQLGEEITRIDMSHIGVTGCSYAGKMALFCGALDERVALTIAQEPGGGGAAAWRVSHEMDSVECLDKTDYHWFKESMKERFAEDKVYLLPHDHHSLCALVCPRALLMLGNPDYTWLADPSAQVSMNEAIKVWQKFGIEDRIGYSIIGGHPHCRLPENQYPVVEAFIDKFLLGKQDVNTIYRESSLP
ncbi:MAG: hypothetical protein IKH26_13500 [Bacteroidaceae bacterium]|nr:hypothetical protein [Bacteroidaceae bacterium]